MPKIVQIFCPRVTHVTDFSHPLALRRYGYTKTGTRPMTMIHSTRFTTPTRRLHGREWFAREGKTQSQTIRKSDSQSPAHQAGHCSRSSRLCGTLPKMPRVDCRPGNRFIEKTGNALFKLWMATSIWRARGSRNGGSTFN